MRCFRLILSLAVGLALLSELVPAAAATCSSGQYFSQARSRDIANASGNGAQAAWEEQNYDLATSNDYVYSGMRIVTSEVSGAFRFVEAGFVRDLTYPYYGNKHYKKVYRQSPNFYSSEEPISRAPSGAHTWHIWQVVYDSNTGGWAFNMGDSIGSMVNYGLSPWVGTTGRYISIGLNVGNSGPNCTTAHITYYGSPSTSSSFAFQYRTGSGFWTTWGSGWEHETGVYKGEWLSYAIYRRAWGP